MNLVFAGTPAFALPALQRLHAAGHVVAAVYTQPDRPAGRGRQLRASPIKDYALTHGMPVRQPTTLRDEAANLAELAPDALIVVAYGLILPAAILAIPRLGCINVHASLLPRWRGAAPIARAIEAGDEMTGITIMQMEAGLDTGPMLLRAEVPIINTDTAETLERRLAPLGAETLVVALTRLDAGELQAEPQDAAGATYAPKLQKPEAVLDWSQSALVLDRKIRAFNPRPVASTTWHQQTLRVWEAAPMDKRATDVQAEPGTVLAAENAGVLVQTGSGALNLRRLQAAGGRVLSAAEFLNGTPIKPGDRLGS